MMKLEKMNCDTLVQNSVVNSVCLNHQNQTESSSLHKPTDTQRRPKFDFIVFNNQTDRLIKKQSVDQSPTMSKYNLRKKSTAVQAKSDCIKKPHQQQQSTTNRHLRGLKKEDDPNKPKKRNSQLSRYKRKNANARERVRVQEINAAFELLKRILPRECFQQQKTDEKLTKIATLRGAAEYIGLLRIMINQEPSKFNIKNCKSDLQTTSEDSDHSDPKVNHSHHHHNSNQTKMDTLPEISFISSDELSRLSSFSDEGYQLSESFSDDVKQLSESKLDDQSIELSSSSLNGSTNCSTIHDNLFDDDLSSVANQPTLVESDDSNYTDSSLLSIDQSSHNNQLNNQTQVINSPQIVNPNHHHSPNQHCNSPNETYDPNNNHHDSIYDSNNNNQTYTINSSSIIDQYSSIWPGNQQTTQAIRNVNHPSSFHLNQTHESMTLREPNHSGFTNQYGFNSIKTTTTASKNVITSTPLLANHDHNLLLGHIVNHQLQSTLFSPIKNGDENQAINYLSMKSLTATNQDDNLFGSLVDIENECFMFNQNEGFDLIM